MPSDYGDEEDREDLSDVTGSQITSRYAEDDQHDESSGGVKSSTSRTNEQDYIKQEINNIIAEAKQNNQYLTFLDENKKYLQPSDSS